MSLRLNLCDGRTHVRLEHIYGDWNEIFFLLVFAKSIVTFCTYWESGVETDLKSIFSFFAIDSMRLLHFNLWWQPTNKTIMMPTFSAFNDDYLCAYYLFMFTHFHMQKMKQVR